MQRNRLLDNKIADGVKRIVAIIAKITSAFFLFLSIKGIIHSKAFFFMPQKKEIYARNELKRVKKRCFSREKQRFLTRFGSFQAEKHLNYGEKQRFLTRITLIVDKKFVIRE